MYLRKSRADVEAEARGEGETLARHEKALLDLARVKKIDVSKIYKEVVSGETISSRPVMQHVLTEVEQGRWKGVLVMEVERLARGDTMDQGLVAQTFKYSNTKIITPMKVYDPDNEFDEEYFEFGLFMSRREYKTINRRLQRGRAESVKEGKYVGNKPPYGYKRKKLTGQKGYTLEPHPDQEQIVKLIFSRYTSGRGISLIVRELNELKIPAATGGIWVVPSVRTILSNPVYTGKIRWNFRPQVKKMIDGEMVKERPRARKSEWIIAEGLHQPIISQEEFDKAQILLAENPSTPAPKHRGVKNPLAGLVECGKCGRKMVRRPYSGRYPDTLMCPITACNNVSSQLDIVENKLLQSLAIWLDKYRMEITAEEENDQEIDVLYQALERLTKEEETLEKQKEKLHDLLEQEVYSIEVFLERVSTLNGRAQTIKTHKEELANKIEETKRREKTKAEIIPAVKKAISIYWGLETAEKKNKLLKKVLEKVVYTKELSGRWHAKPEDFELVIYPKLPR